MWFPSNGSVLLMTFVLSFLSVNAVVKKKEFCLYGPYHKNNEYLNSWDLTGTAQVQQNSISLTTEESKQSGAIWNKYPCMSNTWELQVKFRIFGDDPRWFGHGMGIWYARDTLQLGHLFGSKEFFSGLGIIISTYGVDEVTEEVGEPHIFGMVNNGSLSYEKAMVIGNCHMALRNVAHDTRLAVSYMANAVTVYVDALGDGKWSPCFRSEGVHLPTGYKFGVSASTEDLADNHDVVSVTMLDLDLADKIWEDKGYIIPHAENVLKPPEREDDEVIQIIDSPKVLVAKKKLEEERIMREDKERREQERKEKEMKEAKEKQRREEEKQRREAEEKRRKEAEEKKQKEEEKRREREAWETKARAAKEKEEKEREEKERAARERATKEREKREAKVREEKEKKLAREKKEADEKKERERIEALSPPASFTRKAIYTLGIAIIAIIAFKMCRSYLAQRRERMHKRLF